MYTLVYTFVKNSSELDIDDFFDLISEFGPLIRAFAVKMTRGTVGHVPVHTVVRLQTVDDEKKTLSFSELLCHISKSSDWSQSLIFWSLEAPEGSMST